MFADIRAETLGLGHEGQGGAGAKDAGRAAGGAAGLGAARAPARHALYTARRSGLVFGKDGETPADPDAISRHALRCWTKARLQPIGLHECRHTFASLMIAAGVNAKALWAYIGHASVAITFDRYGHLMPGNEGEAAGLLDAYLEAATGAQAH
jgi:integrase